MLFGAFGETRTLTSFQITDSKSAVSTNSTTKAFAVTVGFEPTDRFHDLLISNQAPLASQPRYQ